MARVFDGDGWLQSDRLSRKERRRRERKEEGGGGGVGFRSVKISSPVKRACEELQRRI
ncbi:hypothetical protein ACE6H2_016007 [Prunus campanulata]